MAESRNNSISFLRFAFAAMVVYSHAFYLGSEVEPLLRWTNGKIFAGGIAVEAFFALSGILITTSWLRLHSISEFLWHRAIRLLPALWLCLFVTSFVFTPIFSATSGHTSFGNLISPALNYVLLNLFQPRAQIAIGDVPFGVPRSGDWNGSLWTLWFEAACYVFVAALGALGLLRRWRILGACLLASILFLTSITSVWQPAWLPSAVLRLNDTPGKHLCLHFFGGMLWALMPSAFRNHKWFLYVGGGAIVLLILEISVGSHVSLGPWIMAPALSWLSKLLPLSEWEQRVRGDYSYGLYLYGYPIEQILAYFRIYEYGLLWYFAASLLLAMICAIMSWRVVEAPALRLKGIFQEGSHRGVVAFATRLRSRIGRHNRPPCCSTPESAHGPLRTYPHIETSCHKP